MKLSGIARRMIGFETALLAALVVGGLVYYRSFAVLPFAYGAILGVAVNVAKVVMLDRTVKKIPGMEQDHAANYVRIQQLLRLFLTGAVLVLSAVVPAISLYGAAAGILTYQVALVLAKRFDRGEEGAKHNPNTGER